MVSFPIVAGGFFPWIWRVDQGPQLAFHLGFGATLGLSLHVMGRYARDPADALRLA